MDVEVTNEVLLACMRICTCCSKVFKFVVVCMSVFWVSTSPSFVASNSSFCLTFSDWSWTTLFSKFVMYSSFRDFFAFLSSFSLSKYELAAAPNPNILPFSFHPPVASKNSSFSVFWFSLSHSRLAAFFFSKSF